MSGSNTFIPLVPYTSYDEYEEMLANLISDYQSMVEEGVQIGSIVTWCRFYEGLSFGAQSYWLEHGEKLFLRFTKDLGADWCCTMNTMVVHALNACLRVLIQTHRQMGKSMSGKPADRLKIAALLKRETEKAIADSKKSPNNMEDFFRRNFVYVSYSDKDDDSDYENSDFIPVAQMQEIQVAFAMIAHSRLGQDAAGHILGPDTIREILFWRF